MIAFHRILWTCCARSGGLHGTRNAHRNARGLVRYPGRQLLEDSRTAFGLKYFKVCTTQVSLMFVVFESQVPRKLLFVRYCGVFPTWSPLAWSLVSCVIPAVLCLRCNVTCPFMHATGVAFTTRHFGCAVLHSSLTDSAGLHVIQFPITGAHVQFLK